MATTVGTSNELGTLIENFIYLERDAIAAYDAVIERLESPLSKEKISEFRADHHRHLTELEQLALEHGVAAPSEGDAKEMLTTGKVKMADMVGGDGAILKAMSTNETDTGTAYSNGTENSAIPETARPIFARALEDERRHKAWMDETAQTA